MGGLYAANSPISIVFLTLVLAVAGMPPFLGFWPKLLLLQGFVTDGNWLLVFSILLNSLLTLIAGTRLWSRHLLAAPHGAAAQAAGARRHGAAGRHDRAARAVPEPAAQGRQHRRHRAARPNELHRRDGACSP